MNRNKFEIKEVRVYEDDGRYYLAMKCLREDDKVVEEIEIPKVDICLSSKREPDVTYSHKSPLEDECCYMDTGFGIRYRLLPGTTNEANHVFFTVKNVKEKTRKMTVSEIEKELGYKIEIVSKRRVEK